MHKGKQSLILRYLDLDRAKNRLGTNDGLHSSLTKRAYPHEKSLDGHDNDLTYGKEEKKFSDTADAEDQDYRKFIRRVILCSTMAWFVLFFIFLTLQAWWNVDHGKPPLSVHVIIALTGMLTVSVLGVFRTMLSYYFGSSNKK